MLFWGRYIVSYLNDKMKYFLPLIIHYFMIFMLKNVSHVIIGKSSLSPYALQRRTHTVYLTGPHLCALLFLWAHILHSAGTACPLTQQRAVHTLADRVVWEQRKTKWRRRRAGKIYIQFSVRTQSIRLVPVCTEKLVLHASGRSLISLHGKRPVKYTNKSTAWTLGLSWSRLPPAACYILIRSRAPAYSWPRATCVIIQHTDLRNNGIEL
jgi:hypothetical protein